MAVNKDGKYTKKTPELVKSIEEAFAMDCSIGEICLFANITRQTLINWRNEDPDWSEHLDELRQNPFLLARQTILKGIKDNYQNAMDYLKRKKRKEFGDRQELGIDGELIMKIVNYGNNDTAQIPAEKLSATAPESDW